MEKVFQVRKLYNDVTFIDEFLTEEFCRRNRLFTFAYNQKSGDWEIQSREFAKIKQKLLFQLTNFGQPEIYVTDSNYENRAELLLKHKHEGIDLRGDYAKAVLENLFRVWSRPVNLETTMEDKEFLLRFDGSEHFQKTIEGNPL